MDKPNKAQQIIDFSKSSCFSISEISQICRFLDNDIEATFKIATHAEFLGITMHQMVDQIFSYGSN